MDRDMFCARYLDFGNNFATRALIIARIALGHAKQNDPYQLAAFFVDQQEALPRTAFEPRKFGGFAHHVGFFERKGKVWKAGLGNDERQDVGVCRTRVCKVDFHGSIQPFRCSCRF